MESFRILQTKDFMAKLLSGDTFDAFLLQKAQVVTSVTFDIDGRVHPAFFGEEAGDHKETFSSYSELKPLLFSLIKGKRAPLSLRFILELKKEEAAAFLGLPEEEVRALTDTAGFIATIRYADGEVRLTGGISWSFFTTDRTAEELWDRALARFLLENGIAYDV